MRFFIGTSKILNQISDFVRIIVKRVFFVFEVTFKGHVFDRHKNLVDKVYVETDMKNPFLSFHTIRNLGYLNSIFTSVEGSLNDVNLKTIGGRNSSTLIETKEQFNFAVEHNLIIHVSVNVFLLK